MSEQQPETAPPPGDVIAQVTVVAEAEVIPGPETLAKQAAAAADEPTE
jgi:hypothetical protein